MNEGVPGGHGQGKVGNMKVFLSFLASLMRRGLIKYRYVYLYLCIFLLYY